MRPIGLTLCLMLAAAALTAQEVTLPLERYDELRGRAHPEPEPEPEPEPAVPIAFEQAVVEIAAGSTSARITQELDLALYGSGWQSVPLPPLGTFIDADYGELAGTAAEEFPSPLLTADGAAGRAAYQLWAEVRSTGAPQLAVALPGELIAARRDTAPLVPGRSADRWIVPLSATAEKQVVYFACLVALTLPDDGVLEVPLPAFSAPVGRVETRLRLPADGRRYTLADATRAGPPGDPPRIGARGGLPPAEVTVELAVKAR